MRNRPLILILPLTLLIAVALLIASAPPSIAVLAQTAFPTLPVQTNTPFPTTPTIVPTFTLIPASTNAGCPTPLNLTPGIMVVITGGLNVRSAPSLSAPLITYFSEERLVRLIGGPVCADAHNWWQIGDFGGQPGANTGWLIEGSRDGRLYIAPAAVPVGDGCYPPLPLAVGDTLIAINGVRLRNAPTQSSYTITVVPVDASMQVLEGPACRDGINWWRVSTAFQTSTVPVEGWIAEGFPENYYVADEQVINATLEIPCVVPLTLGPGSRIAVNYRDGVERRLRAAPNVNAEIVLFMPDEIAMEVISGPECSGGYNWWYVRVLTTDYYGWIAEGRPGRYNIEVITRYLLYTPTPAP